MLKLLFIFAVLFAVVKSFDYVDFQRKYCYEDSNVRTTAFYFPYDIPEFPKTSRSGYVCENFILNKDDVDFMARKSFIFSTKDTVIFKNCQIDYFNEYLVSKFPNLDQIYFENCRISLKNPDVIESTAFFNLLRIIGFYQCIIVNNKNTLALQKFNNFETIFMMNSTLQYPYFDEQFFPKQHKLFRIAIDNVNVKSFPKGLFSNLSKSLDTVTCSSCQLYQIEYLFYQIKNKVNRLISFANNSIQRFPSSMDIFADLDISPEINLSGNQITEILLKRNQLKSLKSLKILDLSRNRNITAIGYLAFKDTYLQKLNMSNVNLKTLDKLGNTNLTTIDFSHNSISKVPGDVFEDLLNLKFLDLSQNEIEVFEGGVFESLRNLEKLLLNSNKINEIPKNLFSKMANLEILDLSSNFIRRIEGLEPLSRLRELRLKNNNIKMIPSGSSLPYSLRILDISHNSLDFFGSATLYYVRSLTWLDMSYTNNTYIVFDRESFIYLSELKTLKLEGNKINSMEDIYIPSVKELDLSHNNISTLTNKGMEKMGYLEYLNLSNNRINKIEDGAMKKLSKIKDMDISGNNL